MPTCTHAHELLNTQGNQWSASHLQVGNRLLVALYIEKFMRVSDIISWTGHRDFLLSVPSIHSALPFFTSVMVLLPSPSIPIPLSCYLSVSRSLIVLLRTIANNQMPPLRPSSRSSGRAYSGSSLMPAIVAYSSSGSRMP